MRPVKKLFSEEGRTKTKKINEYQSRILFPFGGSVLAGVRKGEELLERLMIIIPAA